MPFLWAHRTLAQLNVKSTDIDVALGRFFAPVTKNDGKWRKFFARSSIDERRLDRGLS